jgi:two-component system CheB/CheR fusion protein
MDGQDTDRVSVVGIGASAGGIEALREFFGHTPSDSGMAFAVVLHLPENHTSILADILARHTAMPIVVVESDVEVLADHVYLPPAGAVMVLASGRLRVHERIAGEARELSPVTVLFNSLAHDLNEAAVGVVLSGTGNDGRWGYARSRKWAG